jgi:hypothetical protein
LIERRKEKMFRIWNKKDTAVKKWRSRAWSIDPKVTNLTIIKSDNTNPESTAVTDSNLDLPQMRKDFPQFFDAIGDIEQFS